MLLVVAVIPAERLVAMHRVITGIDVQDDRGRRRTPGTDEEVYQVVVEEFDAAGLGGADLAQDRSVFRGQLGLTARWCPLQVANLLAPEWWQLVSFRPGE